MKRSMAILIGSLFIASCGLFSIKMNYYSKNCSDDILISLIKSDTLSISLKVEFEDDAEWYNYAFMVDSKSEVRFDSIMLNQNLLKVKDITYWQVDTMGAYMYGINSLIKLNAYIKNKKKYILTCTGKCLDFPRFSKKMNLGAWLAFYYGEKKHTISYSETLCLVHRWEHVPFQK